MAARPKQGELPLRLRLKVWWEGYDPTDLAARLHKRPPEPRKPEAPAPSPPSVPAPASDAANDPDLPFGPWDKNRVEIAQYVWGEGYCGPGGPEHIVSMSKLLALSPEMSLLEIGSNLGGPARTLAESFGSWVTGYEESERLATLANEKSHMLGLLKKATVRHYDPATAEAFDRNFDRAFAKEALFTLQDKARLLTLVNTHLKPSGLFLITDYVLGAENAVAKEAYRDWRTGEEQRHPVHLVTAKELAELCRKAGFVIRVNEDVSDTYIGLINRAWKGADAVAAKLVRQPDGGALIETLLKEAELWSRRVRLLEAGDLRVWRILAGKKADKPTMMSDW